MSVTGTAKSKAVGLAKKALATANIDPALVKAAIRRPADVHGGPRVRRWPWPRRRHIDTRERDAVMKLFEREIRQGGAIVYGGVEQKGYCDAFVRYLGGRGYAHAVNSGTNAVYVALRALDLPPGSEVIVPPITDAGGTMPVALMNCIPVPADSAPGSLNTSVEEIAKVMTERTSAIVVAHIAGHPVDMDPIIELANARGIPIVEDCAQALGAVYKGRMCGSLGTIGAFSSMFGKQHCTGGQGGVVFTQSTLLFARIRQIADRGKPYGVVGPSAGNVIASLNFNQDEISMAIGRVQLEKLPAAIEGRRAFAAKVRAGMKGIAGVTLIGEREECLDSPWFLMLRIDPNVLRCSSSEFARALELEGVGGVNAGYPFYPTDSPWYREGIVYGASGLPWALADGEGASGPRPFELPNAHEANRTIVRVDVHESLGANEARDLLAIVAKLARWFAIEPARGASAAQHSAQLPASSPAPSPASSPSPAPALSLAAAKAAPHAPHSVAHATPKVAVPAMAVPAARSQKAG
jgi:dTDP-4-amino-4,6-dideoxygalactose transaminase